MRHVVPMLVLGAWIAVGPPAPGAEPKGEIVRLVFTDGAFQDVRGPVERRDGQIYFRMPDGRLASVREAGVREVRSGPAVPPAPAPAAQRAPVAAPDAAPTGVFTNADLPPAPVAPAASEPPAPEVASPTAPAPPEPGAAVASPPGAPAPGAPAPGAPAPASTASPAEPTEGSGVALTPQPTLVAGHDREWWGGEADRRRREIVALEEQENVTYRLWVCAMHAGEACTPLLRAPANRQPTTPEQITLVQRLGEIRREAEGRRAELADFLAAAMRAGVPAGWVLPGAEPPQVP